DIVTIITIDEFMPVVTTPPLAPNAPTAVEGTISTDGSKVTFGSTSVWINGDKTNDTPKIEIGDLVFFKGQYGNAIQTVTAKDSTSISFEAGKDYFNFNPVAPATSANTKPLYNVKQINPGTDPTYPPAALLWPQVQPVPAGVTVLCASPGVLMTPTTPFCAPVTLFKASMITYYVDNSDPKLPRLTRLLNHRPKGCTSADAGTDACPAKFEPQALAGIVEDIDLTYDIYDGTCNPTEVPFDPALIPWQATCNAGSPPAPVSIAYFENMIRKVNVHVGVRSETMSRPANDYVRNHISSSVNVRSLTAVDRYNAQIQ
ncbi:MAG TPA: hypothetical protein VNG89_05745, partial [Vicinamibacterales bacterium]|nr:hypothetical protein [Vicinamibacterales bacterium]